MHGVELIGGLALLATVRALLDETHDPLLERARVVVVPQVNPDAVVGTLARRRRRVRGGSRGNARGVDLNRNFPAIGPSSWHPFSGSRYSFSPHYMGPHAFSEPETRAVRDLVVAERPTLSVGFHSFGELLLYPWAFTRAPHPRRGHYEALGAAFRRAQRRPYAVGPSMQLYPTIGDMDDWLDASFGTTSFTVEVGKPRASLFHRDRLFDAYSWMNPPTSVEVDDALADVVPAMQALLRAALADVEQMREEPKPRPSLLPRVEIAAK